MKSVVIVWFTLASIFIVFCTISNSQLVLYHPVNSFSNQMMFSFILGLYFVNPVNVKDRLWLICVLCFVVLGCSWWIGWQSSKDSCISSGLFWVWWLIFLFSALFKSVTKCKLFICTNGQVRLRDHGVLDFDASDLRRQPPVDTTWQQVYFACLIVLNIE